MLDKSTMLSRFENVWSNCALKARLQPNNSFAYWLVQPILQIKQTIFHILIKIQPILAQKVGMGFVCPLRFVNFAMNYRAKN